MILIGGVQVRNSNGANALHIAVGTGSLESVKVLLKNDIVKLGINVPARDENGQNPLDMATLNRKIRDVLRRRPKTKRDTLIGPAQVWVRRHIH